MINIPNIITMIANKENCIPFLEHVAYKLRVASLEMTTQAQSGHLTSCLSAADLVAALFFYAMEYDPNNPDNPANDRFILSKGHAAPLLYAAWQQVGLFPYEDLLTYRQFDSPFEGHPTRRFSRTEAATGSLGNGLSVGAGMALSTRLSIQPFYTYVLLGDAELAEGSVWEAVEIAHKYELYNLVALVDVNSLGQSTESLYDHNVYAYSEIFASFGWRTAVVDGHDMEAIADALDLVKNSDTQPYVIIAKTFKGHGIELVEDKEGYHGKALSPEQAAVALQQLNTKFASAIQLPATKCAPLLPTPVALRQPQTKEAVMPTFKQGTLLATRKAYGMSLAALGQEHSAIVSLDADVKNSTYAELFEQQFPERFFQCYIAEQNMVSMGVGFANRGYIPFISTFAAFFSRAYDQFRMAAIGNAPLRLIGSHAGVSIGQDGPSQMGLEDIALMRVLPGSCVLYPCDAVSTYRILQEMVGYKGISYARMTRKETPVMYDMAEQFPIGGCKLLRNSDHDQACIVAAGITLFEALKAYELLKKEHIAVSVIDLYSIKPIDAATLIKVARASGNRIITVEDHYREGGLGDAVLYAVRNESIRIDCLAVTQLPRSGTPEQLLAWASIDAQGIVEAVRR